MENISEKFEEILDEKTCSRLFPPERSDAFFAALFGDAAEGAYDISLALRSASETALVMELRLDQRPGACLTCNLTAGLPQVFSRHPVIDIAGVVKEIDALPGIPKKSRSWQLGATEQLSSALHIVPLTIELE